MVPSPNRYWLYASALVLAGFAAGVVLAASLGGGSTTTTTSAAVPAAGVASSTRTTNSKATAGASSSVPQTQAAAPPVASVLAANAKNSLTGLSREMPGTIQIAVQPANGGQPETLGGDQPSHGWSTMKVPVLVALIQERGAAGLTGTEQSEATQAIEASDNAAILALFSDLEQARGGVNGASDAVQSVLRASGDTSTVVATAPAPPGAATTFGQTEWAPSDSLRFFSSLLRGCLLPHAQTEYVLGLMRNVITADRWGLGSAGFQGPVALKGGWGPEPDGSYLVRQDGVVGDGSSAVVVAMVAHPQGGGSTAFDSGTAMLTRTAEWLQQEIRFSPHARQPCVS